ncbi:MAG: hypothetical protein QOG53_1237 [Frankiales bacterium]|jgi:hypothetical protein|nr:hypothetical protein [Frankiales bacterium]
MAGVVVALLGVAATYAVRYQPVRHACEAMTAQSSDWQIDESAPTVDTTSVVRAAQKVQRTAEHVSDPEVRAAGLTLSSSLSALADAYTVKWVQDPDSNQSRWGVARVRVNTAWTNMRVACNLPTVFEED